MTSQTQSPAIAASLLSGTRVCSPERGGDDHSWVLIHEYELVPIGMTNTSDHSTHPAIDLDSLVDGSMRKVEIGGQDVLLSRVGEEVFATSAYCTHYGAPLEDGVLNGPRLVCPWHHAVFDVRDGHHIEPPACSPLCSFETRVEDGIIHVSLARGAARKTSAALQEEKGADRRCFAIIGAGAAGAEAAMELRRLGFKGRIALIGAEARLPYDRTLLSKELLMGVAPPTSVELQSKAFWHDLRVDLMLGREVAGVHADRRSLVFDDGEELVYDACLVATGARPKTLPVEGANLPGVATLRSRDDLETILRSVEHVPADMLKVAVVGCSFIALECAAALAVRDLDVTVIAPEDVPFAPLFGERVGRWLRSLHEAEGVRFALGRQVAAFKGDDRLEAVELDDRSEVACDLAIVGIGVRPATDLFHGIEREPDDGVRVGSDMRLKEGLWAAGDIARFPLPRGEGAARIEHWRLAAEQGRVAARSMLDLEARYEGAPFFWSAQHVALYYVGHSERSSEVIFDGAPEDGAFIAYYVEGGRIAAALGVERNAEMAAIQELMREHRMPDVDSIRRGRFDALATLRRRKG